ncbi:MAG: tripartite tricarboxylate transporter substrate binding protein [Betaproteobacteria bacterium]|nr:tripartite tricarboxylate transporter substrate binding protein [Betaproteobacteria bacterium]
MLRFLAAALAAIAAVFSGSVSSQAWPSRPVKIIVPYTPGGSSDFTARTLAERLGPLLGGQVVVENRPGGNTLIGTESVVKSAPDGYTLLLVGLNTYGAQPHLNRKLPYDVLKDLTPINNAIVSPLVISVHPSVPVKNVRELIAYARANPGKVNYGTAGVGNTLHLATEMFKMKTGVNIVDVPYKGASQAVVDLLAGNIQLMFDLVQTPLQHIRAGNLRALATTWEKRASALPDVPTLIEQGLDYNFGAMIGLMGPAGMPRDVVNRLHAEIAKVMAMPDVREIFAKQAMEPALFASPEAYAEAFRNEVDNMGKLVRAAGIQPQ